MCIGYRTIRSCASDIVIILPSFRSKKRMASYSYGVCVIGYCCICCCGLRWHDYSAQMLSCGEAANSIPSVIISCIWSCNMTCQSYAVFASVSCCSCLLLLLVFLYGIPVSFLVCFARFLVRISARFWGVGGVGWAGILYTRARVQ